MSKKLIVIAFLTVVYFRSSDTVAPILATFDRLVDKAVATFRVTEWGNSLSRDVDAETSQKQSRIVPSKLLTIYARQLAQCTEPGPRVDALLDETPGSPVEKLILAYERIREQWIYRRDDLDGVPETFQSAERSLRYITDGEAVGDCEDLSSLMVSICRKLELTARIVIRDPKAGDRAGHAYAEVLISKSEEEAPPILDRFAHRWNVDTVAYQVDELGVWVKLDFLPPQNQYQGGSIDFFIWPDGSITVP